MSCSFLSCHLNHSKKSLKSWWSCPVLSLQTSWPSLRGEAEKVGSETVLLLNTPSKELRLPCLLICNPWYRIHGIVRISGDSHTPILTWRKSVSVRKGEQSCFTGNFGSVKVSKGESKVRAMVDRPAKATRVGSSAIASASSKVVNSTRVYSGGPSRSSGSPNRNPSP